MPPKQNCNRERNDPKEQATKSFDTQRHVNLHSDNVEDLSALPIEI